MGYIYVETTWPSHWYQHWRYTGSETEIQWDPCIGLTACGIVGSVRST